MTVREAASPAASAADDDDDDDEDDDALAPGTAAATALFFSSRPGVRTPLTTVRSPQSVPVAAVVCGSCKLDSGTSKDADGSSPSGPSGGNRSVNVPPHGSLSLRLSAPWVGLGPCWLCLLAAPLEVWADSAVF